VPSVACADVAASKAAAAAVVSKCVRIAPPPCGMPQHRVDCLCSFELC
jgi:hypothetical protein